MLTRLVVGAVLAGAALVGTAATAAADPNCREVEIAPGRVIYVCDEPGQPGNPGGPGGGGGGGAGGPSCELRAPYDEFCRGQDACWGNNPAAVQDPTALQGTPKPSEDAYAAYRACIRPDGSTYDEWYWATEPEGPTPAEAAQQAFGALVTPPFTPAFNPRDRTLVNLETWWWAGGATGGEIVGTGALGIRAIGGPDRIEVDPGDGSGVISCAFTTRRGDDCVTIYRRASRPTYEARMRLVYAVRFEQNGAPFSLPGLPTELASPWESTAVDVDEVQSVVRP